MCDSSFDESQFLTDESSSSESESDYDLIDPEAHSFDENADESAFSNHPQMRSMKMIHM